MIKTNLDQAHTNHIHVTRGLHDKKENYHHFPRSPLFCRHLVQQDFIIFFFPLIERIFIFYKNNRKVEFICFYTETEILVAHNNTLSNKRPLHEPSSIGVGFGGAKIFVVMMQFSLRMLILARTNPRRFCITKR